MESKIKTTPAYSLNVEHLLSRSHHKCLDVKDRNEAEGAELQLWDLNLCSDHNSNQIWVFRYHGDDVFSIGSKLNDLVLTSDENEGDYNAVWMKKFSGTAAQLWKLEMQPDGAIGIINHKTGLALDLHEDCGDNGTTINTFKWHGGNSQKWLPEEAVYYFSILDTSFLRSERELSENRMFFKFHYKDQVPKVKKFWRPSYVLLDEVKAEIINKIKSKSEPINKEIARARYKISSLAGEAFWEISGESFPKEHIQTKIGADSPADIAILDAAIAYAKWPYAIVIIETLDTGIMCDASSLFKKGLLIGCTSYMEAFEKSFHKHFGNRCEAILLEGIIDGDHIYDSRQSREELILKLLWDGKVLLGW